MHPIMSTMHKPFGIDDAIPIHRARIFHKLCAAGGCAGCRTKKSKCKQPCYNHGYFFHSIAFMKMLRRKHSKACAHIVS